MYHANTNHKIAGVAILIMGKVDFKTGILPEIRKGIS